MLDMETQKKALHAKLEYYNRVISIRPPEYGLFKLKTPIPRINRALCKISDGTYGYCDDCGDQIPEERLKLIPAAVLCIDCQRLFEDKQ